MGLFSGLFGAIVLASLIVLVILWIFMPFAVFGIKDLAKTLIAEQRKTNALLEKLTGTPTHHAGAQNEKPSPGIGSAVPAGSASAVQATP